MDHCDPGEIIIDDNHHAVEADMKAYRIRPIGECADRAGVGGEQVDPGQNHGDTFRIDLSRNRRLFEGVLIDVDRVSDLAHRGIPRIPLTSSTLCVTRAPSAFLRRWRSYAKAS